MDYETSSSYNHDCEVGERKREDEQVRMRDDEEKVLEQNQVWGLSGLEEIQANNTL